MAIPFGAREKGCRGRGSSDDVMAYVSSVGSILAAPSDVSLQLQYNHVEKPEPPQQATQYIDIKGPETGLHKK